MRRALAAAIRVGRGRWAALGMLVLLLPLLALPDQAAPSRLRLAWLDFYQVMLPRAAHSQDVTIVEIDETSLRKLGQWPWPRHLLARLIERIGEAGAAAIGLDIVMPEPDRMSAEALLEAVELPAPALREALAALPSNDARLAAVIGRYPVVLGAAGADRAASARAAPLVLKAPVLMKGGEPDVRLRHYAHKLVSLAPFQQAAAGQGLLNVDLERGVLRRVPLVGSVQGTLVPALSLELMRVAIAAPATLLELEAGAIERVRVGPLIVPTQPGGRMWVHFSRPLERRYVSAQALLDERLGGAIAAGLRGKIVLVGVTGLGFSDQRLTARGDTVAGIEVHAQMIESFREQRFLLRPPWMPTAEAASLVALGGLLVVYTPRVRRKAAALLLGCALALLAIAGFALFVWRGLLFDAATVGAALFAVFATLASAALLAADQDRRASLRSLRAARDAAARLDGELQAARRMQLGILPAAASSFPRERRFELAAAVEPARSVGGDLYDFFMLDARRLFFHVADVSGKGIPASLFMAISKVLLKSLALRSEGAAEDLLTHANVEIARDNREALFVTAFAGVLDVETGELRYWNAGHESPLLRAGATVAPLDSAQAGPPLCVLERYRYDESRARLAPGSLLVLFTDGVPEAENAAGELFGRERLRACVQGLPPDAGAAAALDSIRAHLARFVADAPASDDVTLLALRWIGPGA